MAFTQHTITGIPQDWLEIDYEAQTPVPAPDQRWTKDPIDAEWFYDPTDIRFGGQQTTTILFSNFLWTPNDLPLTGVVQSITTAMRQFLLGGLFTVNDLKDGKMVMTIGKTANPTQTKPNGRDYADGTGQWQSGVIGGSPREWPVLWDEDPNDEPTNAELMNMGTGWLYSMISKTGKMQGNGDVGIAISEPKIEIVYIIDET